MLEERLASSREETLYLREPPDRHALIQLEKLDSRVDRVQELEEKFRDLRARAEGDSVRLESTTARVASTSRDVHAYLAALTLGIDPGEVPVWRALPIRVYADRHDPELVEVLSQRLLDLVSVIGFEPTDEFPEVVG